MHCDSEAQRLCPDECTHVVREVSASHLKPYEHLAAVMQLRCQLDVIDFRCFVLYTCLPL